jgi:hypothetical protein
MKCFGSRFSRMMCAKSKEARFASSIAVASRRLSIPCPLATPSNTASTVSFSSALTDSQIAFCLQCWSSLLTSSSMASSSSSSSSSLRFVFCCTLLKYFKSCPSIFQSKSAAFLGPSFPLPATAPRPPTSLLGLFAFDLRERPNDSRQPDF